MITEWQQRIAEARENQQTLELRGSGTKHFYGRKPNGNVLDTCEYSGIVNYEPSELVVTVRTGTSLAALESTLAEQNQMLAFEPPHFGDATIGGCIAAGLAGPRRVRVGSVRDFVLGAKLLDGNGNHLEFGGQVMKNVAGYDVSRFLAGSMGCLGIITEMSLKVLPLPEHDLTLRLALDQDRALSTMSEWASKPLPVSATMWHDDQLYVRLSGAASAINVAAKHMGGETISHENANDFWQSIKEQQHSFFNHTDDLASSTMGEPHPSGDQHLWRIALPANQGTFPLSAIDSDATLLEWNGTQRWIRTSSNTPALAEEIWNQAKAMGGHATLFRTTGSRDNVFAPLLPMVKTIHQRLKTEFDPDHIFNPGRMYADI